MSDKQPSGRNDMAFPQLLARAWSETPPVHKSAANLLIHLFAVPLFVTGHVLFVVGILSNVWLLVAALACVIVSLALQSLGHSLEQVKPAPFDGARDFVRRLYAEQFCNFWRFLFSGRRFASVKGRQ